jgi:hypothetical protein
VQQPLVCNNNSIEESVIAAFDTVQNLVNGKHIYRLLLRFVYIHLVRVIDIYRAAVAKDQVEGQVSRGFGQRDITVAIDMYLAAKKKDSKGTFQNEAIRLLPSRQAITSSRLTTSKAEQFHYGPDYSVACCSCLACQSGARSCPDRSWSVRRLGSVTHNAKSSSN